MFGCRICLKFISLLVDKRGISLFVWGNIILMWILFENWLLVVFVKEIFVLIFCEFMCWWLGDM